MKMNKLTLRDISLVGLLLAMAVVTNYLDSFIPRIHIINVVFLALAFSVIGFYRSVIVFVLFTIVRFFFGSAQFIIGFEQWILATIGTAMFLFFCLSKKIFAKNDFKNAMWNVFMDNENLIPLAILVD